ncbi:MAG: hypothetical protein H7Y22_18285 [Gemmatimonadaceae bacterium]|nr:hypothetical protein [Gloeobacterales cyanobacterium ES-bin-141]
MNRYTGLWKRQSIQLGDCDPVETATVFWLQAGSYFADLRIPHDWPSLGEGHLQPQPVDALLPFTRLMAFGGTTETTESRLLWTHQIDFQPRPGSVDEGSVFWEAGNLIEDGQCETPDGLQTYREVWVPEPLGSGNLLVLQLDSPDIEGGITSHPRGLLVMVGEHFIHLYDDRGYPPKYATPDPTMLSGPELRRLLQFQADYGNRDSDNRLEIRLSSDSSRVGQRLDVAAEWQGECWLNRRPDRSGKPGEQRWRVLETAPLEHL